MTNAIEELVRAATRLLGEARHNLDIRYNVSLCADIDKLLAAVEVQRNTCSASYGACVDSGCERQAPTQPPAPHEYEALKMAAREGKKRLVALENACFGKTPDKIDQVAKIILCAADDRGVHLEDHPAVDDRDNAKALASYIAIAVVNEAMPGERDIKWAQDAATELAGQLGRHERANEVLQEGLHELHSILAKPESDTAAVVSAYIVVTDTLARADAILRGEAATKSLQPKGD